MWSFTRALVPVLSAALLISPALQKRERTLKNEKWGNEPVEVLSIKVKGKTVRFDEKTLEDNDWLNGFTVSLKNTSNLPIIFAEIELIFPRPNGGTPDTPNLVYRMKYGKVPTPDTPHGEVQRTMPGETVDVKLSEDDVAAINMALERHSYPPGAVVLRMSIGSVVFDDFLMWKGGKTYQRDREKPGKWKVIAAPQRPTHAQRHGFPAAESSLFTIPHSPRLAGSNVP